MPRDPVAEMRARPGGPKSPRDAANAVIATHRDEFAPRIKAGVNRAWVTKDGYITGAHDAPRGAVRYRRYVARTNWLSLPQRKPLSTSVRRAPRRRIVRATAGTRAGPRRSSDDPHEHVARGAVAA